MSYIVIFLVLLLAFSGCGESDEIKKETGLSDSVKEKTEEVQKTKKLARDSELNKDKVKPPSDINVNLVDHKIEIPNAISSGIVNFHVKNSGAEPHSFEIEGLDIEAELDDELDPGESGTLTVELGPGVYKVYCPVKDNEAKGMWLQISVQ